MARSDPEAFWDEGGWDAIFGTFPPACFDIVEGEMLYRPLCTFRPFAHLADGRFCVVSQRRTAGARRRSRATRTTTPTRRRSSRAPRMISATRRRRTARMNSPARTTSGATEVVFALLSKLNFSTFADWLARLVSVRRARTGTRRSAALRRTTRCACARATTTPAGRARRGGASDGLGWAVL